jgi:hypothetical protein
VQQQHHQHQWKQHGRQQHWQLLQRLKCCNVKKNKSIVNSHNGESINRNNISIWSKSSFKNNNSTGNINDNNININDNNININDNNIKDNNITGNNINDNNITGNNINNNNINDNSINDNKGLLTEGEGSVFVPTSSNQLLFKMKLHISFFYKATYPVEEVNCTDSSPSVRVPCPQNNTFTREPSLKGKAQYSWPPCTNLFGSASFDISNIIYIFLQNKLP